MGTPVEELKEVVEERETRKLASIQVIDRLDPILGADRIEQATILGWHLIVKRGEFKVGDKCVYFEVDSKLKPDERYSFLERSKYRIKAMKMRGVISMGLALPISMFEELDIVYPEVGYDVSEILNVTKYEIPENSGRCGFNSGKSGGDFPYFVPKTDELRIQSYPKLVNEFLGEVIKDADIFEATGNVTPFGQVEMKKVGITKAVVHNDPLDVYVSVKYDGTSSTFFYIDKDNAKYDTLPYFGVCSRRLEKKVPLVGESLCVYWAMAKKYELEEKFSDLGRNLAIQGEICGPGIQNNKLGLSEIDLFVYNVFDIDEQSRVPYKELKELCESFKLNMVDVIYEGPFKWKTVDELVEFSKGEYTTNPGQLREGIVIRPIDNVISKVLRGRASFKVINPEYLL